MSIQEGASEIVFACYRSTNMTLTCNSAAKDSAVCRRWRMAGVRSQHTNFERPIGAWRLLKLVRRGGLIAVDNTLALSGAPIIELGSRSTHAQAMLAFNELACKDERVDEAMLTVGEGLTLLRVR